MGVPEVVNPQNCSGCGTCELACSFHNGQDRSFQPSAAHIQVVRSAGLNRFHPEFLEECNGCGLCAAHCDYNVLAAQPGREDRDAV